MSHGYTDSNRNGNSHIHAYADTYCSCYCDTYSYSGGQRNTYCLAKLHTELHIHVGDRNAGAGSHRHYKPLR